MRLRAKSALNVRSNRQILPRRSVAPGATGLSGTDSLDPTRLARGDGVEDRGHERAEVQHAIGSGSDDDYGKRKRRDLLLELDAAVHCEQHVISVPHAPEQLAIFDPGPTASDHSLNSMAVEFSGIIYRELLVKKDAHRP